MIVSARVIPVVMSLLLVLAAGCRDVVVDSVWSDTAQVTGGENEIWSSALQHIEHIDSMTGAINDEQGLTLGLVPFSREKMAQIAGAGCIVWFNDSDPDARFGIRFPQGDVTMAARMMRNITKSETETQLADLAERETAIVLLGDDRRIAAELTCDDAAEYGIEPTISEYHGRLLLTMKIPFEFTINGNDYEIQIPDDRQVRLFIETPAPERRDEREIVPMGMPSDYDDDPYIRSTSRQSSQSVGEYRGLNSPINLYLTVKLAG